MKGKILVTPRSVTHGGHPSLELLRAARYEPVFCTPGVQPDEKELLRLVPDCVGYLAGVEPITASVIRAATRLRVISRNGTGVDSIDLNACESRKIHVCRAAGANARGVAELAMGLVLALARSIPCCDRSVRSNGWSRPVGFELEGATLGIVGCGKIGRLLARFALAMDIQVMGYDVAPDDSFQPGARFSWASLDDLLCLTDIVSLHCPSQPSGQPVLDAERLRKMKRGVMIVNTARYDLIDPSALLSGLESGQVAGVALDVFETEPPSPNDPLVHHDRVILTPHVGGLTAQSIDRAMFTAVRNLLEALECAG